MKQKNSTSDMACLASQFPRLVGLGQASQVYRKIPDLAEKNPGFTDKGNEITFATIGNSSCAEGHFWEAVNAIGVLQLPVIISIWDDGYGISVANDIQMTKSDVSEVLSGFQNNEKGKKIKVDGRTFGIKDLISLDGTTGEVMAGEVETQEPKLSGDFAKLMKWADEFRTLDVRTNADSPADSKRAREFGAKGIGLCRTEHMFFEADRIIHMRAMILAETEKARCAALKKLLPFQRKDFE